MVQHLESERAFVSSPISYIGAFQRIWRGMGDHATTWWEWSGITALLVLAWIGVTLWYLMVLVLMLTPIGWGWIAFRLHRRAQRRELREQIRIREEIQRQHMHL